MIYIDGLDGQARNKNSIAIHGRIDQMTLFHNEGTNVDIVQAPWDQINNLELDTSLLKLFQINGRPKINVSYKLFILLFDECYTDLYRISEAQQRMHVADKIVFIGTSFSVNITQMALTIARSSKIPIEVVDPNPIQSSR